MNNLSSIHKSLKIADQICDYIPLASAVSNLVDLIAKKVLSHKLSEADCSLYENHIRNKPIPRIIISAIPLAGNLAMLTFDATQKILSLIEKGIRAIKEPAQASTRQYPVAYDNVTHLQRGIPNPSRTSCWVNSAVMSFYPLRHLIEGTDDEIFNAMLEVYRDPKKDKEELARLIKKELKVKPKAKGDADMAFRFLFHRLIEKKPSIKDQLTIHFPSYKCDCCSNEHPELHKNGVGIDFLNKDEWLDPKSKNTYLFSKFIPYWMDQMVSRECRILDPRLNACEGKYPERPAHPKYFFLEIFNSGKLQKIHLDSDQFEWNGQKFQVVAINESNRGHATCNVRSENGKWYKYDDGRKAKEINPTQGNKPYTGFLIEKL